MSFCKFSVIWMYKDGKDIPQFPKLYTKFLTGEKKLLYGENVC